MKTLGKVGKELELLPDARARADHKGKEIAKALRKQRHNLAKFDVEVVDVRPIPQGVEVFARVWNKDGSQVGFGDGTIDIERFRFLNPPIMVPDGTKGVNNVDNFKEDSEAALLQSLDHTISVVPRHGAERVVKGRVGSTTSTFYSEAGDPGTTVVDGLVMRNNQQETFAQLHDGVGTFADNTTATQLIGIDASGTSAKFGGIYRFIILFDTSSIPDTDTVSAATLSFYGVSKDSGLGTPDIYITSSTPASNTTLVSGDYTQLGTTSFGSIVWASLSVSAYNDFNLNGTGISNVSKTGISKFGARSSWDILNDSTGLTWVAWQDSGLNIRSSDQAGTSSDPTLVVTHAVSGPAASRRSIIVA
jgi:hypothetical protein